jgi:hypothetical protein
MVVCVRKAERGWEEEEEEEERTRRRARRRGRRNRCEEGRRLHVSCGVS